MKKRILVVDDDEMVLIALNELLGPEGYHVDTVLSAREALEKLGQNGYDLLLQADPRKRDIPGNTDCLLNSQKS